LPGLLWLALAGTLVGCRGGKNRDENLGVVGAGAANVVDVHQLQNPDVLLGALRLSGADRDKALGAHRRILKQTQHIEPAGRPVEDLAISATVDSDGKGGLHLVEDTGKTSGMEAVVLGGALVVWPKDGQPIRRRPEPGEVERLRRTVEEPLAAMLSLLRSGWVVEPGQPVDRDGRKGTRFGLRRADKPSTPTVETEPGRTWRQAVEVDSLAGEVVLDGAGVLLSAKLDAVYRFRRDTLVIKVTVQHTESLAPVEPIVAPANTVASPERVRPMLDRQTLLDGIAPPRREVSALH